MTEQPTPDVLLNCPFCGSEAAYEQVQLERGTDDFRWSVGCGTEGCIGFQALQTFSRKKEACEAWNRRV